MGNSLQTSFVKIMGASPTIKVLDFLIENDRESWSMNEISEHAKISYATLKTLLPKLVKSGLLKIAKVVGRTKLYTMETNNPVVKQIYKLEKLITKTEIDKLL